MGALWLWGWEQGGLVACSYTRASRQSGTAIQSIVWLPNHQQRAPLINSPSDLIPANRCPSWSPDSGDLGFLTAQDIRGAVSISKPCLGSPVFLVGSPSGVCPSPSLPLTQSLPLPPPIPSWPVTYRHGLLFHKVVCF